MPALDAFDSFLFSLSRAFCSPLGVFIQIQVCFFFFYPFSLRTRGFFFQIQNLFGCWESWGIDSFYSSLSSFFEFGVCNRAIWLYLVWLSRSSFIWLFFFFFSFFFFFCVSFWDAQTWLQTHRTRVRRGDAGGTPLTARPATWIPRPAPMRLKSGRIGRNGRFKPKRPSQAEIQKKKVQNAPFELNLKP